LEPYTVLIQKLFNYKVVDRIEGYNFDIKFVFIRVHMKCYELFFDIEFLDRPVLTQMRLKTKFRDRDDTTEQVWEPKRVISKFRERDDTYEQV
jgi:hypothetical protein